MGESQSSGMLERTVVQDAQRQTRIMKSGLERETRNETRKISPRVYVAGFTCGHYDKWIPSGTRWENGISKSDGKMVRASNGGVWKECMGTKTKEQGYKQMGLQMV